MKHIYYIAFVTLLFSCNKKTQKVTEVIDNNEQVFETMLSLEDSAATVNMQEEVTFIGAVLDSLSHGNPHNKHHWDSLYRHHDSLFWHHHSKYHHGTYQHDDHAHHWVPYDSTIHHSGHYHHRYNPNYHDSLVSTHNGHQHTDTLHHFNGHNLKHHKTIDSLHHNYEMAKP